MFNQDAIFAGIILFILYTLITEYMYYNEKDYLYITDKEDFFKYEENGRYDRSLLYKYYKNNTSDCDKLFIRDLICHEILNYKEVKPSFKKKCKSIVRNILFASIGSGFILNSSFSRSFKQNTLGYFMTNMI